MAKFIDGKTYNKITHLCDLLVLFNNDLVDGHQDIDILWDFDSVGIFTMNLFRIENNVPKLLDSANWFFNSATANEDYDGMIEKINAWKEDYAGANDNAGA